MTGRAGPKLPAEPLQALLGPLSVGELARAAGVAVRSVWRWWAAGAVPAWAADDLAVAVGEHPAVLWPAWLDLSDDVLERPARLRARMTA